MAQATGKAKLSDEFSQKHSEDYKKVKDVEHKEYNIQTPDGGMKKKYIETRTLENGVKKNKLYRLDKNGKVIFNYGHK